jgi:hypothetical protein
VDKLTLLFLAGAIGALPFAVFLSFLTSSPALFAASRATSFGAPILALLACVTSFVSEFRGGNSARTSYWFARPLATFAVLIMAISGVVLFPIVVGA